MKKQTLLRIFWFLLPLAAGGLAAILSRGGMDFYETAVQPPVAPPPVLFPIAWSILYTLMGISAVIAYNRGCVRSLLLFCVQLLLNFLWPLLFFNARALWASFVLLLLLFVAAFWTAISLYRCRPLAGILFIPYLLWLGFAAYLNAMIAYLN